MTYVCDAIENLTVIGVQVAQFLTLFRVMNEAYHWLYVRAVRLCGQLQLQVIIVQRLLSCN